MAQQRNGNGRDKEIEDMHQHGRNDYRGEERTIIETYIAHKGGEENLDPNTAYFMLVNLPASNVDLLGKMPMEEQIGFLYTGNAGNNNDNLLAVRLCHELGHGAYHLEHTFISLYLGEGTKGTTENLMDYQSGIELWKYQWDIVHAPGHVWGILKKDKDQEASVGFYYNPSGYPIFLNHVSINVNCKSNSNGYIDEFYYNNSFYKAKIINNLFYGYFKYLNGNFTNEIYDELNINYSSSIYNNKTISVLFYYNLGAGVYAFYSVNYLVKNVPINNLYYSDHPKQVLSNILEKNYVSSEFKNIYKSVNVNYGGYFDISNKEINSSLSLNQSIFIKDYFSNDNIDLWKDLYNYKVNESVLNASQYRLGITLKRQDLDNATSDMLNVDYYSVNIIKLPDGWNYQKLVNEIRLNFVNNNLSGISTKSIEYIFDVSTNLTDDKSIWESSNPLGACLAFKVEVPSTNGFLDEGLPVICSDYFENNYGCYWIFSPIYNARVDLLAHPLAGNRQFGIIKNCDGTFTFYTRGVDKPYDFIDSIVKQSIFDGADDLWRKIMDNLKMKVNNSGGVAQIGIQNSKQLIDE